MSRRNGFVVTAAVLAAAICLASASPARAGDRVHAAVPTVSRTVSPVVSLVRPLLLPVTISITPVAAIPASDERGIISLRGPDGQVRHFPVEGGAEAFSRRVIVLRPGDSVTIQLAARK